MSSISRHVLVAGTLAAVGLSGCVVVPVGPDGTPVYPAAAVPAVIAPAPVYAAPAPVQPAPATMQARLYPANEIATHTGMLAGTVTNMMTGKGLLQLDYQGELTAIKSAQANLTPTQRKAIDYWKSGGVLRWKTTRG